MQGPYDDVVIHVGYHKAGSTLLQRRLFIEEHGVHSPWQQDFYHRAILLDRPDRGWAARVRTRFDPEIEAGRARGLRPVLSCEALSGDMWRAGQANGYANFHVAAMLAEAFEGARVAIVHREQVDMIVSLYRHSVRSHWRWPLEDFLDQSPLVRGHAPILNLGYLEFSWLLEEYHRLLGPERVSAMPYELVRQPESWADRWSELLGIDVRPEWLGRVVNPGMSAAMVSLKRRANYAIKASAEPNRSRSGLLVNRVSAKADGLVPRALRDGSDERLRRRVDSLVGDRFAVDNRRLFDSLGEDWSRFGYRAAPAAGGA